MLNNLEKILPSPTIELADYIRQLENTGKKTIKLQTGDPDFSTPSHIVEAALQAFRQSQTHYTDSRGHFSLRQALAVKLKEKNKILIDSKKNILITHGAVHAVNIAIRCLLNEGDEVIINEPYWHAYTANTLLCAAIPKIIPAQKRIGFHLDIERIKQAITSKTRLIILNSPNNPSGAVYTLEELGLLSELIQDKDIYILSDEVYEDNIYSSVPHISIGSFQKIADKVISVFSFSKSYAMTGWRIGYIVANDKLMTQLLKLSQYSITCVSPFTQFAAEAALGAEGEKCKNDMMNEYAKRLRFIKQKVKNSWLNEKIFFPEGTFYCLLDISDFSMSSMEFCKNLVNKSGIVLTPGIAFGTSMNNYVRICFAASIENIDAALESLIKLCKTDGKVTYSL